MNRNIILGYLKEGHFLLLDFLCFNINNSLTKSKDYPGIPTRTSVLSIFVISLIRGRGQSLLIILGPKENILSLC